MQRLSGRLVTGGGRLQESTEPQEASSEKRFRPPRRGRGYCHIWAIDMCRCESMVFKQFTLGQGIKFREFGSTTGYHFPGN